MPSRTFEDYGRETEAYGYRSATLGVTPGGRLTITLTHNFKPKVFVIKGDRVEPAAPDSPSQGGSR